MKVGILGYGSIGKRHADNLKNLGHEVMIHDPKINGLNRTEVLKTCDAFVIASPTTQHCQDLLNCIAVDKPVFVEKPLCSTQKEYNLIMKYAERQVFVGYNLRFHPFVQRAKKEMCTLGRPLWARFSCAQFNNRPEYLRDGVILNWSHEIDLALYLLGPATVNTSTTKLGYKNQDVMADIILAHQNGCISVIHLDYETKPQIRGFAINGQKDTISADIEWGSMLLGRDKESYKVWEHKSDFDLCYIEEMKAFIAFCEGKVTEGCTMREALQVMHICLDVRKQAGLEV